MGDLSGFLVGVLVASVMGAHAGSESSQPDEAEHTNDRVWIVEPAPQLHAGDLLSAVHEVPGGFRAAIVSWNAFTPPGTWLTLSLRAQTAGRWTRWYDMGHWSSQLSGGHRHSVANQQDADGSVATDTLDLTAAAQALQVRATLRHDRATRRRPTLRLIAVATDLTSRRSDLSSNRAAWGVDLAVPERSQRRARSSPDALGGGGDAWCSPATVSMIMGYWAQTTDHPQWDVTLETAAAGTYDPVYDGCGNWPFNVAFASEHGLEGWVQRLSGIGSLERLIAARVPVVASIKVGPGELGGAPYEKTAGHLLVVRGFTPDGDVIVNDPYAMPGSIRRVYGRTQFEHVWLTGSKGAVYLIAPPGLLRKP